MTAESHVEEQVYVVQLKAPSHFSVESELRQTLPNPEGFEVTKGYWVARPPDEQSALAGYSELVLTIRIVSRALRDAEEHALKVGRTFGSLTAAFGGYPLDPPRLDRIAAVDAAERLVSQHNYHYDDQLHESLRGPFDPIVQHRYQRYLEFFSSTDEGTRYRLQSAIHWYGIAIGADDPTVSYVAAWTGLECIGPVMDGRFHPHGPRARCSTCGNRKEKRDRKMAGIDHVFHSGILEPDERFSPEKAHRLRSDAVHGLRSRESLVQDCSRFGRFLTDLLNLSIVTGLTQPDYDEAKSARSLMAGDYEFRPCSRASIRFSEGRMEPFLGEWVGGNVTRKSQWGSHGLGDSDLVMEIGTAWALDERHSELLDAFGYEEFTRLGQEGYPLRDVATPPLVPWASRPSSPVWQDSTNAGWEFVSGR